MLVVKSFEDGILSINQSMFTGVLRSEDILA